MTPSSVEEYPREAILITSFHAARRPASKPWRNVFFRSLDIGGIRRGIRGRWVKAFPEAGDSADVPEVFLRRRLRLRLRISQLRMELAERRRLRLELPEA